MEAVINRQCNIYKDVKTSLKEAIDVIAYCKSDWLKMEEKAHMLMTKWMVDTTVPACNNYFYPNFKEGQGTFRRKWTFTVLVSWYKTQASSRRSKIRKRRRKYIQSWSYGQRFSSKRTKSRKLVIGESSETQTSQTWSLLHEAGKEATARNPDNWIITR